MTRPDPIAEIEAFHRNLSKRLTWLLAAVTAIDVVAAIVVALLQLNDVLFILLSGLPIAVVSLLFGLHHARKESERTVAWFRTVQPRVRDVDSRRGLALVFDNGLVVQPVGPMISCSIFFSPVAGSAPSIDDLRAWRRAFLNMKTSGSVGLRSGPPEARAALAALCDRLGIRRAKAVLYERRPRAMPDPRAPLWTAALMCYDPKWNAKADRLLASIDGIADLLRALRTQHFPGTAAPG